MSMKNKERYSITFKRRPRMRSKGRYFIANAHDFVIEYRRPITKIRQRSVQKGYLCHHELLSFLLCSLFCFLVSFGRNRLEDNHLDDKK